MILLAALLEGNHAAINDITTIVVAIKTKSVASNFTGK